MIKNKQLDVLIDKASRIPYITLQSVVRSDEGYYRLQFIGCVDMEIKVVLEQSEEGDYFYDCFVAAYGEPNDEAFDVIDMISEDVFTWTNASTSFDPFKDPSLYSRKDCFSSFTAKGFLK